MDTLAQMLFTKCCHSRLRVGEAYTSTIKHCWSSLCWMRVLVTHRPVSSWHARVVLSRLYRIRPMRPVKACTGKVDVQGQLQELQIISSQAQRRSWTEHATCNSVCSWHQWVFICYQLLQGCLSHLCRSRSSTKGVMASIVMKRGTDSASVVA